MSRQMNLPQIQRILQEFERESSMMDMKEEMMGESIDDAMEDDVGETEEEEGDRILDEVLAEIGVSVGQQVRFYPLVSSSSLSAAFKVCALMHTHACGVGPDTPTTARRSADLDAGEQGLGTGRPPRRRDRRVVRTRRRRISS